MTDVDPAMTRLAQALAEVLSPQPAAPAGEAPSAAAAELTPGQQYVREQQQAAAEAAAAQLPEGIMTKAEMDAHEQLSAPKSYREQQEQLAESERFVESWKFYEGQR